MKSSFFKLLTLILFLLILAELLSLYWISYGNRAVQKKAVFPSATPAPFIGRFQANTSSLEAIVSLGKMGLLSKSILTTEHEGKILKITDKTKTQKQKSSSYNWVFMIVSETQMGGKKKNLYMRFDPEELSRLTVTKKGGNSKLLYSALKEGDLIIYEEKTDLLLEKQFFTITIQ